MDARKQFKHRESGPQFSVRDALLDLDSPAIQNASEVVTQRALIRTNPARSAPRSAVETRRGGAGAVRRPQAENTMEHGHCATENLQVL